MMKSLPEALLNQHISPGQPQEEFNSREDGGNYLRRPKNDGAGVAPAEATWGSGNGPAIGNWERLRQSPRIRCSGSVEFRTLGGNERMWGTLTDVSLHGCFVEMNTAFPVGTAVDIVLKSFGIRIQVAGEVRTSYPSRGMGVCFAEIEPEERGPLKELLDALAGQPVAPKPKAASAEKSGAAMVAAVDAQAFLDRLTEFFRDHVLLSREQFHKIAERVRES